MAGLYIHIPFCKKACHYCNFHFSTNTKHKDQLVQALCQELTIRAPELERIPLESIYFGGGTPSLLTIEDLNIIFHRIEAYYNIESHAEITLEANPDDLTASKIKMLSKTKINRLSIGIQSFFDEDLILMNRAHSAQEAKVSIQTAQSFFDNITIDLLYGMPQLSNARWRDNLNIAFDLGIHHLSSYALTVEPKTALEHYIRTAQHPPLDDAVAASHFQILVEETSKAGFIQYEVCSFGQPGYFSTHNTNYWLGKPYLGVGPSAHSFDGVKRSWNISNNSLYLKALAKEEFPITHEILTKKNRFNEYLMTGLRTMWGISLQVIKDDFGMEFFKILQDNAKQYLDNNTLVIENNHLKITTKGQFLCDGIASDLFII